MTRTTRRTHSHPLRRTFAAAAVVPALLLPLAACGSEDGSGGDSGSGSGGGSGGDEGGKPDKEPAKPLTEQQLSSALLTTKEAPGYQVRKSNTPLDKDADAPQASEDCRPVIDVFVRDSEQKRTAWAAASLVKGGKGKFSTQSTIHQVLLSAYKPGDAETFLGSLKTATNKCSEIADKPDSGGKQDKVTVEPQPSPGLGDDSVRFAMVSAEEGGSGSQGGVQVTVVRSGANTMTFMSTSLTGKGPEQPKKILDKQLAKLEGAGKN
jgi:hypothetical protein